MANVSIYSQFLQPQRSIQDYMGEYDAQDMRKEQLGAMRSQNQLQALAMRQKMDADTQATQDRNVLQTLATTAKTPEEMISGLRKSGRSSLMDRADAIEKAMLERGKTESETKKNQAQTTKAQVESEKEQLATAMNRSQAILQAVSSARDQTSYMQAVQSLAQQGIDVSQIPQQFNPQYVQQAGQQALSMSQRLEQVWKQKGFDLDVQKFGEQSRHNKASEGLTARGQNMADSRAKQGLDLQREAGRTQIVETADGVMLVDKGTGQARPAMAGGAPLPGKLTEAARKQAGGIDALSLAIEDYRKQLGKWGKTDLAKPDARAAMGTAYNNLMLQAKEAYNLGVLNGPDLSILTSVITDPVSIRGAMTSSGAMDSQAKELDRLMQRTKSAVTGKPVPKQPTPAGGKAPSVSNW